MGPPGFTQYEGGDGEGIPAPPAPGASLGDVLGFVTEFNENVGIFVTLAQEVTLVSLLAMATSLGANTTATQAKTMAQANDRDITALRQKIRDLDFRVSRIKVDIFADNPDNEGYSVDGRHWRTR